MSASYTAMKTMIFPANCTSTCPVILSENTWMSPAPKCCFHPVVLHQGRSRRLCGTASIGWQSVVLVKLPFPVVYVNVYVCRAVSYPCRIEMAGTQSHYICINQKIRTHPLLGPWAMSVAMSDRHSFRCPSGWLVRSRKSFRLHIDDSLHTHTHIQMNIYSCALCMFVIHSYLINNVLHNFQ